MPGDPQECRQHARNCQQLAEHAATPEMRQSFLDLAKTWTRLAGELESVHRVLDALDGPKVDGPETRSLLPGYDADSRQP